MHTHDIQHARAYTHAYGRVYKIKRKRKKKVNWGVKDLVEGSRRKKTDGNKKSVWDLNREKTGVN